MIILFRLLFCEVNATCLRKQYCQFSIYLGIDNHRSGPNWCNCNKTSLLYSALFYFIYFMKKRVALMLLMVKFNINVIFKIVSFKQFKAFHLLSYARCCYSWPVGETGRTFISNSADMSVCRLLPGRCRNFLLRRSHLRSRNVTVHSSSSHDFDSPDHDITMIKSRPKGRV